MTSTNIKLRIYIDRLKGGATDTIVESLDPKFLDISEQDEIQFEEAVSISGSAYIVNEFLVISLTVEAHVKIPCSFCNTQFSMPIHITNFLHEEPLENIKQGIFDYGEVLREAILLEIPFYPLCGKTECLNRKEIEKYLRAKTEEDEDEQERYHPFENL